ncbi:MAG: hypothetical protein A2167_03405 [Planctomycetes bacterium RBG_13_46_10]|nr:MAG: hypothetical protein A2167_03405 [Planctomycetes bacterium RBG_13_46_10]
MNTNQETDFFEKLADSLRSWKINISRDKKIRSFAQWDIVLQTSENLKTATTWLEWQKGFDYAKGFNCKFKSLYDDVKNFYEKLEQGELDEEEIFHEQIPILEDSSKKLAEYVLTVKYLCGNDRQIQEIAKTEPEETEQKDEGSKIMVTAKASKANWEAIRSEYEISKKDFGKKIKFVKDQFKRKIIFRDVEHAFILASQGFSKPALILAGGVIEELLRHYLEHKKIKPKDETFFNYIQACEDNGLLKRGVYRLTDSIRDFRNLVHLENEETKRHTVSTATAKGAVASIFTIANDFQ